MTTIVLSIMPGALPPRSARQIAARLGLRLVDQRPFERQVATRSDVRSDHAGDAAGEVSGSDGPWSMTQGQLFARMREQVLEQAADGHVLIVGWAAAAVLQPFPCIMRVAVRASDAYRARQIKAQLAYEDIRTACLEMESGDGILSRFVRRATGNDWQDPTDFDMVLDAARVPLSVMPALIETTAASVRERGEGRAGDALAMALRRLRLSEPMQEPVLPSGRLFGP